MKLLYTPVGLKFLLLLTFHNLSTQAEDVPVDKSTLENAPLFPYAEKEILSIASSAANQNFNQQVSRLRTTAVPYTTQENTKLLHKKVIHQLYVREANVSDSPGLLDNELEEGSGITTDKPTNSCLLLKSGLFCAPEMDDQFHYSWSPVLIGKIQAGRCFGNTAAATRGCLNECVWGPVNCSASDELLNLFTNLMSSQSVNVIVQNFRAHTESASRRPEPLSEVYFMYLLLSQALVNGSKVSPVFQQSFLETSSNLLDKQYRERSIQVISESIRYQAGTLLLQTMSKFSAVYGINVTERASTQNENILTKICQISNGNLSCELEIGQRNSSTAVQVCTDEVTYSEALVTVLVYTNMTGYLPEGQMNSTDIELASAVVSIDVNCKDGNCSGQLFSTITFAHSPDMESTLSLNRALHTVCINWESPERISVGNDIPLFESGHWSYTCCQKNMKLSNISHTVCECTDIGTFAAVLSLDEAREVHLMNLKVIYAVGTSLSLLALIITTVTFITFRSLWSMSSSVHIHLCIVLAIVLLVYAVGGEYAHNTSLCVAFAVLKHYFFTVAFMWILTDGIVLLLRMTVTDFKYKVRYYIIGFIVLAHGVPLLYFCVCLPLGFVLWSRDLWSYGEPYGCFLRIDTNFYLAFLVPIATILMVVVVVFCIVLVVFYQKQRSMDSDRGSKRRPSFQSLCIHATLVIYFGFTWIIASFTHLVYLVYLSTILISFQGVFVFILYTLCSKKVRESYGHCLIQSAVQCKYALILRQLGKAPNSEGTVDEQRRNSSKKRISQSLSQRSSVYSEIHENPLAIDNERNEKAQDLLSPRSIKTRAATNPSDVSLWRIAHRANTNRDIKVQPTIEEIEENVTVVTFL